MSKMERGGEVFFCSGVSVPVCVHTPFAFFREERVDVDNFIQSKSVGLKVQGTATVLGLRGRMYVGSFIVVLCGCDFGGSRASNVMLVCIEEHAR